jgi:hypothetical protein
MFAAASSTHAQAQEFRIEEASSLAGLAVDGLKPRTIAFVDRPSEELIDPDAGLIRFQDWAQAEAARKAILDTVSELTSNQLSRSPSMASQGLRRSEVLQFACWSRIGTTALTVVRPTTESISSRPPI